MVEINGDHHDGISSNGLLSPCLLRSKEVGLLARMKIAQLPISGSGPLDFGINHPVNPRMFQR